jgi:copper chaperone CopZ
MADREEKDHLAVIRIEGMHCHNCESAIRKTLSAMSGVHEVEVDFNSSQASVLYNPHSVTVQQLVATVTRSGYRVMGFSQAEAQADSTAD